MIIWAIAKTTFGDAMRKKILQVFVVVAVGLIILSLSFSQTLSFSSRQGISSDLTMLKSMGLGLMALAGLLISLVLGVSLIPQEIERRTIYTILSKPVKRYEFVVGKYLGAVLTLAVTIGLMGVVLIAVLWIKALGAEVPVVSAPTGIPEDPVARATMRVQAFDPTAMLGVALIFMQFVVLSSVVMLLSVLVTPTVNFFLGAAVYIMGVMAAVTQSLGQAKNANVALKVFYRLLYLLLPNFDKYNVTNPIIHPDVNIPVGPHTLKMVLYTLLYSLIMMLIGIIVFERKEV